MYSAGGNVTDVHMQEEYRLLSLQTTPRPRTEAEYNHTHASATLPFNKAKNRYTDVLPVEATRIKLAAREDDPGSDYINANQVTDPTPAAHDGSTNDHYICSQAPLQNTLNDFWRMVWEQDVSLVVVLMRLTENGKVKGHRYWPSRARRTLHFNDISVTLVKGKHFPHRSEGPEDTDADQTTIRVLELRRGSSRRNLVQLHFKDWPDFGVPESTEPIRHLVRIMDFYRGRARLAGINGPVLIHCSAGIGRTGTYLAIVFALNAIKHMKQLEASSTSKASGSANGAQWSPSPQKNGNTRRVQFGGTESPSYSTDEDDESSAEDPRSARSANAQYGSILGSEGNSGSSSSSSMSGSDVARKVPTDPSLAQQHIKPSITSVSSPPGSPGTLANHKSNSSNSASTSTPHDSSTSSHATRATLTASADSVEYETQLLSDSGDEDDHSHGLSEEDDEDLDETDSEEDEAEMRHVQSFQRPGSSVPVDVMKIVLNLRKQRNRGMVQTEDQYKFIYRVLFDEIFEQRLNVSGSVMQFMADAASDFTDSAPLSGRLSTGSSGAVNTSGFITSSGGGDRSARRKSQPRSPRSTQVSLGSSVSIGASGLSRLSASTTSNALSYSSSFSDDEGERKSRLKQSADSSYACPLLSLDSSTDSKPPLTFAQRRNLAQSCANIQPTDSTDSLVLGRSAATTSSDSSGAPILDLTRDLANLSVDNFSLATLIAQQQNHPSLASLPELQSMDPTHSTLRDSEGYSVMPSSNQLAHAQSIDKSTVTPPSSGPRRPHARRSTPPNTRHNNQL